MKKIILIMVIAIVIFASGIFVGDNIETVTKYNGQIISVE